LRSPSATAASAGCAALRWRRRWIGLVLTATAAQPVDELEVPLGTDVVRLEQQSLAIGALGVGEMGIATGCVRSRFEQGEQAEIVERPESQLGIE